MAASCKKLLRLLIDRDMKKKDHAEKAGISIAAITFPPFFDRAGIYLDGLFVNPEYRGHDNGMIREFSRIAEERGCGRLELSCLDWNKPSIDFYLSLGAEQMNGRHIGCER